MGDTFETTRVEAFSDGVFAIAITLLVLELSVPEEDFGNLLRGILDQWPSYLAYLTSFWTVGGLWLVHHGVFRRLRNVDMQLVWLNLVLLLAVSFLPFPTRLMAEAIQSTEAERVAVLFYGATLLAISVTITAVARYAAEREELLAEHVSREELLSVGGVAAPSVAFYAAVLLAAIFVPKIAAFGFFAVALYATAAPARIRTLHRGRAAS
jgi:uncharacterized membrane protein